MHEQEKSRRGRREFEVDLGSPESCGCDYGVLIAKFGGEMRRG
jgi:hypothetical protein